MFRIADPIGPPIAQAAGSVTDMGPGGGNNYEYASGAVQSTAQFPAAGFKTGDKVRVKCNGDFTGGGGPTLLLQARGGCAVEIPGNPGNLTAANGQTDFASQGGALTFELNAANEWRIIQSA